MPYELPDELASRYRMVGRLGHGAAKDVYRAVDLRTGADVAIARLPSVYEDTFEHEVVLVSQIASAYVPPCQVTVTAIRISASFFARPTTAPQR